MAACVGFAASRRSAASRRICQSGSSAAFSSVGSSSSRAVRKRQHRQQADARVGRDRERGGWTRDGRRQFAQTRARRVCDWTPRILAEQRLETLGRRQHDARVGRFRLFHQQRFGAIPIGVLAIGRRADRLHDHRFDSEARLGPKQFAQRLERPIGRRRGDERVKRFDSHRRARVLQQRTAPADRGARAPVPPHGEDLARSSAWRPARSPRARDVRDVARGARAAAPALPGRARTAVNRRREPPTRPSAAAAPRRADLLRTASALPPAASMPSSPAARR